MDVLTRKIAGSDQGVKPFQEIVWIACLCQRKEEKKC